MTSGEYFSMALRSGVKDADGVCDDDCKEMSIRGDITPPYIVCGLGLHGEIPDHIYWLP